MPPVCDLDCCSDPKCEAFSFNKEKQLCRHAGAGVHYDRTFTYYEKRQSAHSSPANGMFSCDRKANQFAVVQGVRKH